MMKKVVMMFLILATVLSFTGCGSKPGSTVCTITKDIGTDEIIIDYDKDGKVTKYTLIYITDVSGLGREDDYFVAMAEAYKQAVEQKAGFTYEYKLNTPLITEIMTMDTATGSVSDALWLKILPEGATEDLTNKSLVKILTDQKYTCTNKK